MNIKNVMARILSKINTKWGDSKKTAEFWDETDTAVSSEYWWNIQAVRGIIQKEITGDPNRTWYTKTILERPTPFGRILTFGDGNGPAAEAHLTRKDASEILYVNISSGEGTRFKQRMKNLCIDIPCHFVQANANTFDFSSLGLFDTIIDIGAFHHFENFESIFPQLNKMLKPDGFMMVDEYVGPSKWKFEQPVVDIINQWLTTLPKELIANSTKVTREDFFQLWKQCGDPSESVRSGELDEMLRRHFTLIEATPFGGTLLQPFFLTSHMNPCRLNIHNWHNTEIGASEAERLTHFENKLIRSNEIGKDYIYYLFKKAGPSAI